MAYANAARALRSRKRSFASKNGRSSVLAGMYPSVAGGALAFLTAAWLLARQDPAATSNAAIALAFFAHQLAVLFAIAWRVRWLGWRSS